MQKKKWLKKDGQREEFLIDVSWKLDFDIILNYILCR